MKNRSRYLTHAAIIAALYTVLTHMQNLILPNSASMAIQFRVSEALCVLALFTPSATAGLSIGCLLFNLSFTGALPYDWIVGTAASFLSAGGMWLTRKWTVKGYPLPAMLLPPLINGLLVGWELALVIGGGFWLNALYVAIGEGAVLLSLGSLLYAAIHNRHLEKKLFG